MDKQKRLEGIRKKLDLGSHVTVREVYVEILEVGNAIADTVPERKLMAKYIKGEITYPQLCTEVDAIFKKHPLFSQWQELKEELYQLDPEFFREIENILLEKQIKVVAETYRALLERVVEIEDE